MKREGQIVIRVLPLRVLSLDRFRVIPGDVVRRHLCCRQIIVVERCMAWHGEHGDRGIAISHRLTTLRSIQRPGDGRRIYVPPEHLHHVILYHVVCIHGPHIQQSMDQPGKSVNPARGQLNRENEHFPVLIRA